MGLFDDLLPSANKQEGTASTGLFDDLVPSPGSEMETGASRVSGAPETSVRPVARGGFDAVLSQDEAPTEEQPVRAPRMRGQIKAQNSEIEPQTTADSATGDGTAVGRALERGALRVRSSLPMGLATADATAIADAALSDSELIIDSVKQATGLKELPDGFDLSTPEKASAAILEMGFDATRPNLFREILTRRQSAAQEAKANPEKFIERGAQNLQEGSRLIKRAMSIPMSESGERMKKALAADESVGGTIAAMLKDPMAAAAFLGETGIESGPTIAASLVAGVATRSPTVSSLVMGGGTIAQEFGASASEFLQENGVKLETEQDAINLLNNRDLMSAAAERGITRGVVIAAFEMLGQGVAAKQLLKSKVGDALVQSVVQAATGSAGEAGARLATGQELSGQDILIEGLAEFVTAPAEVGAAALSGRSKTQPKSGPDTERPNSPRLTPSDRASPHRNDLIDDGKRIIEQAISGQPITAAPTQPEAPNATGGFDTYLLTPEQRAGGPVEARNAPKAPEAPETGQAPSAVAPAPRVVTQSNAPSRLEEPEEPEGEVLPVIGENGEETGEFVRVNPSTGQIEKIQPEAAPEVDTTSANSAPQPKRGNEYVLRTGRFNGKVTFNRFDGADVVFDMPDGGEGRVPLEDLQNGIAALEENGSPSEWANGFEVASETTLLPASEISQKTLMILREDGRLHESGLSDILKEELDAAGIKKNSEGYYDTNALEAETDRRIGSGEWDATMPVYSPVPVDEVRKKIDGLTRKTIQKAPPTPKEEPKKTDAAKPEQQPEAAPQPVEEPSEPETKDVQGEEADTAPAPRSIEVLTNDTIKDIETDAETFQYKGGGDTEGVTERLRGVSRWDDNRTGIGLVYEYEDGRRVIVDGHQRLGLAKRLAGEGQNVSLPVRVLRQSDGISEAKARSIGAEKNIAEGSGTALDAAKVFRDTRKTASELNLPMSSAMVRTADGLRGLSDSAFGMVNNGVASERDGALVGSLVKDTARHEDILGLLAKLKPSNATQAESIVRQAMQAEVRETQTSLFGEEEVSQNLYLERAKILDRAIKDLGSEISTFKTLVNRADAISEAGNVLQSETNEARLKADTEARAALSKQANTKGPISDALTEAARKYREDGKLADAARAFADAVKRGSSLGEGRGPQAGPARDGDGQAQASGPEPVSAGIAGREQTQAEGVDAARAAPRKPASEPSKTIGSAKDPLRKKGDWQDADLVAENTDGTEEEVSAGEAVRSLLKRYAKAKRLLRCVNA